MAIPVLSTARPTPAVARGPSRRLRILRENLTGYAFVMPAMILIFIFGIFPVAFAFFVSLRRWRRFPGEYEGLANYVRALDGLAYVLFFWLALGAIGYGLLQLRALVRQEQRVKALSYLIPGAALAAAIITFINWFNYLLPLILTIPQRLRGQERVQGLFVSELWATLQIPDAWMNGNLFLGVLIGALVLSIIWFVLVRGSAPGRSLYLATVFATVGVVGLLLLSLTVSEIEAAIAAARADGGELPIWSQIILISLGALLVGVGYWLWRRTVKADETRRFVIGSLGVILLLAGGYLLIVELPQSLNRADPEVLRGLGITAMFALGTVPVQLGIGLLLAYLLFQNIRGRSFFRLVYFLPYIMPFVATAVVFNILFSFRPESPANQFVNLFGIPDQRWLLESTGILRLILGDIIPQSVAGPSLALIVIMIYTTWTYIGYDAVVYLAGLGGISNELYEAARIDGAHEWSIFRHITLPLLSPTTFFLMLIAITGTFRAFTQIYVMRNPASQSSVDTLGVHIFETVRSVDPNMGYGSAMAFVLFGVILVITVIQNRIAGKRVFYG